MNYFKAISYLLYHKYRWSKASKIGSVSYDEYVKILGRNNIKVTEDSKSKRIQWEDVCTLYIFRFSKSGDFQIVELEIWFEYRWPWLSKSVLLEVKRG